MKLHCFFTACALSMAVPSLVLGEVVAVVRNELSVDGSIEGNVWLADSTKVTGSGRVLGEKNRMRSAKTTLGRKFEPTALSGQAKTNEIEPDFSPIYSRHHRPTGKEITLSGAEQLEGTWENIENIRLVRGASVHLPPGIYGHLVVADATLTLGNSDGSAPRAHYEFRSVTVRGKSSVKAVGPVTLLSSVGLTLEGTIGAEGFSERMDLRIASGDVVIGKRAQVYADIVAPSSAVVLAEKSQMAGAVVADRLKIESDATLSEGVSIPEDSTSERFATDYAGLQNGISRASENNRYHFNLTATMVDDRPQVIATETPVPDDPYPEHREKVAVFEACCAMFENTKIASGTVSVSSPGRQDTKKAARSYAFQITASDFDAILERLVKTSNRAAGIGIIRSSPLLVNLFAIEVLRSKG